MTDPRLPEFPPTISGEPLPLTNLGTLSTEIESTFLKSPWPPSSVYLNTEMPPSLPRRRRKLDLECNVCGKRYTKREHLQVSYQRHLFEFCAKDSF